ncbi:PIR Superfamily Protein [Plasmodium ovale wallikeri]|uniref:PIR Superfamily Protein n=1 Tax=Plasmodium ovale wallikeri TaxID=864142 RepID=A0A1A9AJZ7_PLAOA|nr:PIR Superfamily Protein [Plasmodium ovale wallikeri]SBT58026.1 PIR Superfamily Protein [Plasmodium ovale wallikeri]
MLLSAGQSFLAELPSFEFFNELNKDISKCSYSFYCENPESNFEDNISLKILCYFFVRNLEILEKRKNNSLELKNLYCNYLVYLIYEKYYNISEGFRAPELDEIFDKLNKVRNTIFSGDTSGRDYCENFFKKKFSYPDIQKRNKFYDYYVNFKHIEDKLKIKEEDCFKYYDYLKNKKKLYEELKQECKETDTKSYCQNIDYNKCDPNELLKLPKCKELEAKDDAQGDDSQSGDPCSHMREWETYYSLNFSDYRVVLLTGLAIWGILITLHFLYKNTPVGLCIRNFLKKKEIIRNNFDEDLEHDMLSDNSDHLHANLETGRYSMGYHLG